MKQKKEESAFGPRDNIPKHRLVDKRTRKKIQEIEEMPLNTKEGRKNLDYEKKKFLVCVTGQQASQDLKSRISQVGMGIINVPREKPLIEEYFNMTDKLKPKNFDILDIVAPDFGTNHIACTIATLAIATSANTTTATSYTPPDSKIAAPTHTAAAEA